MSPERVHDRLLLPPPRFAAEGERCGLSRVCCNLDLLLLQRLVSEGCYPGRLAQSSVLSITLFSPVNCACAGQNRIVFGCQRRLCFWMQAMEGYATLEAATKGYES